MEADLEYVSRYFLKAINASEKLKTRYANMHSKEWATLALFRKEFGDTCSKVKGLLSLMWLKELTRDKAGFFADLREVNYGE
jgi:hypothetical protein